MGSDTPVTATTVVAHSAYHSYSVYLYVAGGVQAPRGSQRTWIKVGAAKRTPDTCTQQTPHCTASKVKERAPIFATRRFLWLALSEDNATTKTRNMFVKAYNVTWLGTLDGRKSIS